MFNLFNFWMDMTDIQNVEFSQKAFHTYKLWCHMLLLVENNIL